MSALYFLLYLEDYSFFLKRIFLFHPETVSLVPIQSATERAMRIIYRLLAIRQADVGCFGGLYDHL